MSMMSLSLNAVRLRRLPRWSELQSLFTEWRQRARSRRDMMALDDLNLWDMGLTRNDVFNEASKPFWRE